MTKSLKRVGSPLKENSEAPDSKITNVQNNFSRRKMTAILMMYCGIGYYGMQKNVGFKTIEGQLMQSLYDADLIDSEALEKPALIRFQRASKTDKNVSALGQVCSIKLTDDVSIDAINNKLPAEIRILDVFRTTKSFHAKGLCKHRVYTYLTPTFAFSPKTITNDEYSDYRLSEDHNKKLASVLEYYKGTHNFHNFTSGRKPDDPSCNRFMIDLVCGEPFVEGKYEYISITITGQSFMLHQIRKMIGLSMGVMRGFCDETVFEKVFNLEKVDIPRAPGLGLILDHVNFDSYNQRLAIEGNRKPIDFNNYKTQISEFSDKYVFSHIYKTEEAENSMEEWLDTVALHTYSERRVDENGVVIKNEEVTKATNDYIIKMRNSDNNNETLPVENKI